MQHADAAASGHEGGQQYGDGYYDEQAAGPYGTYTEQGYAATEVQPYAESQSAGSVWETQWDDDAQSWYYYNPSTGEASWVDPASSGY